MNLAPVTLFVYNRPSHTRQTVEALLRNELASESDLIIFSDAPKSEAQAEAVHEVRNYIYKIEGFKSVTIIERESNFGLARSIIEGVTSVVNEYGRIIVLEDDLETSSCFLTFMNNALDYYKNNPKVMHISGFRYPVESFGRNDTFFLHIPLCWGWATWQRAWANFEKDISIMDHFNDQMIYRFDFEGSYSYWEQLELNKSGKINTWFIFWYTRLFLLDGLALFPASSLVRNIGFDNSGTHCGYTNNFNVVLSSYPIEVKDIPLTESKIGFEKHKKYFEKLKIGFVTRIVRKLYGLLVR